jgi:recombination protein RecA
LLRWGIGNSERVAQPGSRRSLIAGRAFSGKHPCWQVRISGIDNVSLFAEALPMWGPKGHKLTSELARPELRKHRGSQRIYLPAPMTEPVLTHLRERGVTGRLAAQLIRRAGYSKEGLRQILGSPRLRRDRLERLAEALDSQFLRDVLDEDIYFERVVSVVPAGRRPTFDIEVDDLHTFVAEDIVVHNCAAPFRIAEFDILYGKGVSREGSLIDVGVEHGFIKKSGAWFTYEGQQVGQGRENARQFLIDNPDIALDVEKRIRDALGLIPQEAPEEE